MMRSFVLTFVFVLGIVTSPQEDAKPDRTAKRLEKIQEYIGQAGQLYKDQQFQPAANKIDAAQVILERCITDDQAKYKEDLMKEHGRIARAHELLAAAGVNLKELSPFPEDFGSQNPPPDAKTDAAGDSKKESDPPDPGSVVSFKSTVVPILVKHCGTCHVRQSKGDFSMSSFEKLMAGSPGGDSVVAGKPDDSLLFQLMESGDMPPKSQVPEKDLNLVKKWIEEGAQFDGDDPQASLGNGRGRRGR